MSAPDARVILASAARTATPTNYSNAQTGETSVYLVVDLTAFVTTADLTPKVFMKTAAGVDIDILAAAAIAATGTTVYHIGKGEITAFGGITVSRGVALPPAYEIEMTHGNANSHTYSVELILVS